MPANSVATGAVSRGLNVEGAKGMSARYTEPRYRQMIYSRINHVNRKYSMRPAKAQLF